MKNLILVIIAIFSIAIFQSCEKDIQSENSENLVAPELPPVEMQRMPTAELRGFDPDATANQDNLISIRSWAHAAFSILVWHTVVVANMAVPTAAFAMAFNEEPEYIGNATFEWSYNYDAPPSLGGKSYMVVLTGQFVFENEEVAWVMTTSEVGGHSNFEWYKGITSTDNTYGEFTLYRKPANPEKYVTIRFEQTPDETNNRLRFTNVIPGSPDNGHYIEYRSNTNSEMNREFDIQGEPGNFLEAKWNEPAGNGQVRHPHFFNDNEWHCWDTNQLDIDC